MIAVIAEPLLNKISSLIFILILMQIAYLPVSAQTQPDLSNYDYVVQLQPKELKDYFKYTNTKLSPLVKLSVTYETVKDYLKDQSAASGTSSSGSNAKKYLELYYSNSGFLGERRHADWPFKEQQTVMIINKTGLSSAEQKACANAIIMLLVDAFLNENYAGVVIVPSDSMQAIGDALDGRGFRYSENNVVTGGEFLTVHLQPPSQSAIVETMVYPLPATLP